MLPRGEPPISFEEQRDRMVEEQLKTRGVTDARLLAAFKKVPRHLFVPPEFQHEAYADHPLPIGAGQTISQPYMVALMTSRLRIQGHERVLEIGAGSGYQTAILAELALDVVSIERIPELLATAKQRLADFGYLNVQLLAGNGSLGSPNHAPFDAIIVTAAAPDIPDPLLAQLAEGGRMILPIGSHEAQTLVEVTKHQGVVTRSSITGCLFVPLLGDYGWPGP